MVIKLDVPGTAFVSGAGSGQGRSCAVLFAKAGAKLILVDINEQGLDETLKLLPANTVAKTFVLDITKEADAIKFVQSIPSLKEFDGRLDYALNCAGALGKVLAPVVQATNENDDWVFNLNVRAQAVLVKEQLKIMLAQEPLPTPEGFAPRPRGSIVLWSSWAGSHGSKTAWAYGASKSVMEALARSVALSHAAEGIRCNAVAPGVVITPFFVTSGKEHLDRMLAPTPAKRAAEPEEIASCALFLCSDAASYVNGTTLHIDGGWHAT